MSFTPDSKELVASYGGKIWRIPVDGSDPIEIPFAVDVDLEIGPKLAFEYPIEDSEQFVVRQIRDAVPSPDGSRLAFVALDRLYVMDYPGGEPRRLTEAEMTEAQPTWSPDGRWIGYVTWSETEGGHLYKVRSDGRRDPDRLTTRPAIYQQPAWSPDGGRIVMIAGPANTYRQSTGPRAAGSADEFVWVSSDGGDPTSISPTAGRSAPHFTQDPGRIYLTHRSRGLVSIRWDGTDEKEHVKVTGVKAPGSTNPPNAGVIMMAPVGDQALAQVGQHIYVVTVPYVGGETPTISVANPSKATFPARKLTDIGGQFPAWSSDGRKVHWSIGNAHVVYDLDAAKAFEDSVAVNEGDAQDEEIEEDQEDEEDDDEDDKYQAGERRIIINAPRDIPRGTVVLRGARVITMNGSEVIENADVVVRDNRIVGVGPGGIDRHPHASWITEDCRCFGKDDYSRFGRRPCAYVAALGNPQDPGLALPGEFSVRSYYDAGSTDVDNGRTQLWGHGDGGGVDRSADLFHRPRCVLGRADQESRSCA